MNLQFISWDDLNNHLLDELFAHSFFLRMDN